MLGKLIANTFQEALILLRLFLDRGLCHTNIVLKIIHFAFGCKPSVSGSLSNDLKLNELFLNSSLRHSNIALIFNC